MKREPPPISPVLRPAGEVLSLQHGVSWLLLALAAGAVNAGALIACERFVTHVTGTLTRIGVDYRSWLLMLEYGLVLLAFIAGAMASVLSIQGRAHGGRPPLHALPLVVVAGVLVATGLAGELGLFGPLGGPLEERADFAFLSILAFAMGLMNASVASSTALAVRTTHMTGPATDFGVHLATAWLATGVQRRDALRLAALRGSKLVAFGTGAALMVPTMAALGYAAFVAPAALILTAALRSFLPSKPIPEPPPDALAT